ncbi:hypothetical protein Nepgr_005883 [Nepenthes gracilis]|uniref:Uncharacterized protein n=1 Tax=Nepenthes gracilis TaxID=150966 RepID=A0AAD3S4C9_NEPGR|nr:hypothetical protein Nepgr_005883 [Nepenthes gracilis]
MYGRSGTRAASSTLNIGSDTARAPNSKRSPGSAFIDLITLPKSRLPGSAVIDLVTSSLSFLLTFCRRRFSFFIVTAY